MMTATRGWLYILAVALTIGIFAPKASAGQDDDRRTVVSITICGTDPGGSPSPNCNGAADTQQPVLSSDDPTQTINEIGVAGATDEHSSVFPPGYLRGNGDYLFFVASGFRPVNRDIGLMVLSGRGPDSKGQWSMKLADGYGDYGTAGRGVVFLAPVVQGRCPDKQDETFDLGYAAPGTLFRDPTSESQRLLMVYEGTNSCVGNPGGPKIHDSTSYETIGVATSLDGGRSWPRYATTSNFNSVDLPFANPTQGPHDPIGAMGTEVCTGNVCPAFVPDTYGRYRVLSPPLTLHSLYVANQMQGQVANSEPAAFLDDMRSDDERGDGWHGDGMYKDENLPYVYAVFTDIPGVDSANPLLPNGRDHDLMVARARLTRDGAPLTFYKWNGSAFSDAGEGGVGASILPDISFNTCGGPSQSRGQGSISYITETRQYILTFVCTSPGDPAGGINTGVHGAAWFYALSDDLSAVLYPGISI
ncbi:MAG: hypothetical protein LAO08_17225 [Acidobacteriia bacterium]|nr:hypothetical protein [Terriglobia bacterium]